MYVLFIWLYLSTKHLFKVIRYFRSLDIHYLHLYLYLIYNKTYYLIKYNSITKSFVKISIFLLT